jgi:hypothetical protein
MVALNLSIFAHTPTLTTSKSEKRKSSILQKKRARRWVSVLSPSHIET